MGLIRQLFKLQSADGSEITPARPKTLAELSAALAGNAGSAPESFPEPMMAEPVGGGVEFSGNSAGDDVLGFLSQCDGDLVFLPPPAVHARVEAPLEASLAPTILGGQAAVPAAVTGNSDSQEAVTPQSGGIRVLAPHVHGGGDSGRCDYQPSVMLPWPY